jgi:DNA-binding MarR family transcriptional regulator
VTLNIPFDDAPPTVYPTDRDRTASEVLDELTSWNPRERMSEFRTWLAGSLSLIHLNVLSLLEADGPLSMTRLADALDVSVASVTGIVDRLEQRDLVERRRGEGDRRVILVHPTAAGEAVFSDLAKHRRASMKRLLEEFSDQELAATLVFLRAMRRARAVLMTERQAAAPGPDADR